MHQLHASHSLPWFLIGDFNEILHSDEYWGSGSRPFNQIAEFTRVVDDYSLIYLGYSSLKLTWCNRRFKGNLVYARLDRCLHNLEWMQLFPQSKLSHVSFGFSDHMALLVKLQTNPANPPTENTGCSGLKLFGCVNLIVKTLSDLVGILCNGVLQCSG